MNLDTERLDVVGTVGTTGEVGQVELDLVPALVEAHGHGADEGLHSGGGLVVASTEAAANALIVEDLNLEGEVLLEVLDDHDEEGKLDAQGLVGLGGAGDVTGVDIRTAQLKNGGLNIGIGKALDVSIADLLVPDLQGLGADGVKDGQESRLECVLEHCSCGFVLWFLR